jgi:sulfur relay protein TusB/DsrH
MESILLLLNSAPSNPNAARAFQAALTLRAQGHAVSMFLLQDAVLAALKVESLESAQPNGDGASSSAAQALNAGVSMYALGEDLALRGFDPSKLPDGVCVADYVLLVDLFDQHTRVIGAL